MSEKTELEKKFRSVCIVAVILGIALLISLSRDSQGRNESRPLGGTDGSNESPEVLIRDRERLPFDKILTKRLRKEGFQLITAITDRGKVRVVDVTGKDAKICGSVDKNGLIPKSCDLENVTVETFDAHPLMWSTRSPGCVRKKVGPHIVQGC